MLLKNFSAAAAGVALLAAGPAVAANSAPTFAVGAASTAALQPPSDPPQGQGQGRGPEDGEESTFQRYLPIGIVVVFTIVFAYFLYEELNEEDEEDIPPNPGPVSP